MFHPIKNPRHYAGDGKISCKDALKSMMSKAVLQPEKAYWWGCAFKYLWRWPLKEGRKDLEKCKQCIDYLLELPDDVYPTVQTTKDEHDYLMQQMASLENGKFDSPANGRVDAMRLTDEEIQEAVNGCQHQAR